MVPGFVAGQYSKDELVIDVYQLAQRANARMVIGRVVRVDPESQKILLENGEEIFYDVASFDIGSTVAGLDVVGVKEYAVPTRPIGQLCHHIEEVIKKVSLGNIQKSIRILVVGGGAGGVELSFTLEKRLGSFDFPADVTMIEKSEELLLDYSKSIRRRILSHLDRRGIEVILNSEVREVLSDSIILKNGQSLDFDLLIWVTGPWSQEIFKESGFLTDARGFVLTRPTLQFEEYDNLFGVGDCATLSEAPLTPKAGVYAVRQGPYLTYNLYRWLEGSSLKNYHPQGDFLTLLNLGNGRAVGGKWGCSIEGRWVMKLKDHIDRKFVADFS
jgi:selenide,water dikinase